MKAVFADLSEQTRQQYQERRAYKANERHQVFALYDAVQVAIASGQQERAGLLLMEMRSIVDSALARRRRVSSRAGA